jgi:hypothetical protein
MNFFEKAWRWVTDYAACKHQCRGAIVTLVAIKGQLSQRQIQAELRQVGPTYCLYGWYLDGLLRDLERSETLWGWSTFTDGRHERWYMLPKPQEEPTVATEPDTELEDEYANLQADQAASVEMDRVLLRLRTSHLEP